MLHGLPNLEELACCSVHWTNPIGSHAGAEFTMPPDWEAGSRTLPPFAPKIRNIQVCVTA